MNITLEGGNEGKDVWGRKKEKLSEGMQIHKKKNSPLCIFFFSIFDDYNR